MVEKQCPHCKMYLTYLNFDVKSNCMGQVYNENLEEETPFNNPFDFDIDCLTEDVVIDNFCCPECAENVCNTKEEAKRFFK